MNHESSAKSVSISVKQVIISVLGLKLDVADLRDELSLYSDTVGLDSLTLLHIITRLERELSFELDDEAMMSANLVDVGSLVALVQGHLDGEPPDNIDTATAGQGAGQ